MGRGKNCLKYCIHQNKLVSLQSNLQSKMEYDQNDNEVTKASEPAVAYSVKLSRVDAVEIERECLSLEESKRLLLEKVHQHYHSKV